MELEQRLDDSVLVRFRERIEEREAEEPVADIFGDRAIAGLATVADAHFREVERQVVEDAFDVAGLEVGDEAAACFEGWQQQIEHVIGLLAMGRDDREADAIGGRPSGQVVVIAVPRGRVGGCQ